MIEESEPFLGAIPEAKSESNRDTPHPPFFLKSVVLLPCNYCKYN
jgi:hypothetical protein